MQLFSNLTTKTICLIKLLVYIISEKKIVTHNCSLENNKQLLFFDYDLLIYNKRY